MTTRIPQYVQRPGEARVWYAYPGQSVAAPTIRTGWAPTPAIEARVLDDGTTQQRLAAVNTLGHVTERTDPLGRRTSYTYAANGIDLQEVRQTTGTANDLIASYGNYTAGHLPQTVTDAAGQTTTLTYTATGSLATSTNAKSETTTYTYDTNDRLTLVTGPAASPLNPGNSTPIWPTCRIAAADDSPPDQRRDDAVEVRPLDFARGSP